MKKTLIAFAAALALVGAAQAQHNNGHRPGHWPASNYRHDNRGGHGGHGGIGWFVPALITGAIVYGATRPSEPAQVVVVPAQPPQQQPICPYGTDATYSRMYVQDASGRFIETYKFTGCLAR
jgi:hypothetical protein